MTAERIDGKALAAVVRAEAAEEAKAFAKRHGRAPHLSVVLASDDPASQVYVRNKERAAAAAGISAETIRLAADTPASVLLDKVRALSEAPNVDAILVQLPLPPQHDARAVVAAIAPQKDADGLHLENAGRLARGDESGLIPCTPLGCIRLIEESGQDIAGAAAVVVGRSGLVGRPLAELLLNRHATVTICHSRTRDLAAVVEGADIVVAAVGRAEFIRGPWIRPGATVIDVGINRGEDGKLIGDVDFAGAAERARAITPVPGGVGPMTIAYLLKNTVAAATRSAAS